MILWEKIGNATSSHQAVEERALDRSVEMTSGQDQPRFRLLPRRLTGDRVGGLRGPDFAAENYSTYIIAPPLWVSHNPEMSVLEAATTPVPHHGSRPIMNGTIECDDSIF